MLSCFSQAPVAYWKKLVHAFAVLSIIAGSTAFSGASCVAGACARTAGAASTEAASSARARARPGVRDGVGIVGFASVAACGMAPPNVVHARGRVNQIGTKRTEWRPHDLTFRSNPGGR